MIAYDFDGVLATTMKWDFKPWSRMTGVERRARQQVMLNQYANALPLFNPPEERFCVITARKHTADVVAVSDAWLAKNFPGRVITVRYLFLPRTIENVVTFKSHVLKSIEAVEFTEDNRKVLAGVRKALPELKLHFFDGSKRLPFP